MSDPTPCDRGNRPGCAPDVCHRAGLSYRQLDYWTTTGRLVADKANPGSGIDRTWPDSEVEVATIMRRLIDAGMTLQAAHDAAREACGDGVARIGPGLFLVAVPR